jgi:hypothetical protein
MTYGKININAELRKAAKGKKTNLPADVLVYLSLKQYPGIQKQVAAAFSIKED